MKHFAFIKMLTISSLLFPMRKGKYLVSFDLICYDGVDDFILETPD